MTRFLTSSLRGVPCRKVLSKRTRAEEHPMHVGDIGGVPSGVPSRDILIKTGRVIKHAVHSCDTAGVPG